MSSIWFVSRRSRRKSGALTGGRQPVDETLHGVPDGELERVEQPAVQGALEDPDPMVRAGDRGPFGFPVRRRSHEVAGRNPAGGAVAQDGLHGQLAWRTGLELLVDAEFGCV